MTIDKDIDRLKKKWDSKVVKDAHSTSDVMWNAAWVEALADLEWLREKTRKQKSK